MSVEKVEECLRKYGKDKDIIKLEESAATVELAAKALHIQQERITKTLAFRGLDEDKSILVAVAGDAKIDNAKFKNEFGLKARMLTPDETLERVGHKVGGVCPFGVKENVDIYCDTSLKRFDTVFPACGDIKNVMEIKPEEMYKISNSIKWVDVCKNWRDNKIINF